MSSAAQLAPDYEERAKSNKFASPKEIVDAMNRPGTVILDVRTEEEIAADKLDDLPSDLTWTKTGCTRAACPGLESDPTQFVPDDKSTTIIVHCASGARANRAKMILESKGYTNVLNGGGLKDLVVYPKLEL